MITCMWWVAVVVGVGLVVAVVWPWTVTGSRRFGFSRDSPPSADRDNDDGLFYP